MLLKRSANFTTKREKYNYMSAAKELAKKVRIHALEMAHSGGAAHTGSSFSIADILAVLYTDILQKNSQNPNDDQRDQPYRWHSQYLTQRIPGFRCRAMVAIFTVFGHE